MQRLFILLTGLMLFFSSCHKDSSLDDVTTETPGSGVIIENATEGRLFGTVVDLQGNPLQGVEVRSLNKSAVTDEHGVFVIKDALLAPTGIYVTAQVDGYHLGSDMVYSTGGDAYSRMVMIPFSQAQTFDATNGGEVNIDGGGSIVFPPQSIVHGNTTYTGSVKVYAHRLATDDADFYDMMPGGLYAQDVAGRNVVLGSAGMVAVELRGTNGEALQLKAGTAATTTFPIAEKQLSSVPDEIGLWSFDEIKGLWIEEGTAYKKGAHYEAELTHFSFWNCDAPYPLIKINGQLKAAGTPLANYRIEVMADGLGTASGYSNSEGNFCGLVPKDVALTVKVYSNTCDEYIYSGTYGPFSTNADLGMINIDSDFLDLEGVLLCNGEPIETGYVMLSYNGATWHISAENGSFNYHYLACQGMNTFTIQGIDYDTGKASEVVTIDVNNIPDPIELQLCVEGCNLTLDIQSNEGQVCSIQDVEVTAIVSGGSGDYSYQWDNGSTSATVPYDSIVGTTALCVEVIDNQTDCVQNFCKNIQIGQIDVFFELYYQYDCLTGQGQIFVYPIGGEPPYKAYIDGIEVASGLMTDQHALGMYDPGDYEVSIVDAKGCEVSNTLSITPSSEIAVEIATQDGTQYICEEQTLTVLINGAAVDADFLWDSGESTQSITVNSPGTYCVQVSSGGCEGEACIRLNDPFENFNPQGVQCTPNGYEIWAGPVEVTYSNNTYVELINPDNPTEITIDVYASDDCQATFQYPVMNDMALGDFTVFNTTCGTCDDGYVTWINNSDEVSCQNCAFNSVQIYNVNDLTTDLYDLNESQGLPAGDYVFIATNDLNLGDGEYGCVVIRKEFKIE